MDTLPLGTTRFVTPSGIEVIRRVGPRPTAAKLRHTVIVAGQHGSEMGPVEGLAGSAFALTDGFKTGLVTIIRAANPVGIAMGRRELPDGTDMNRGWTLTEGGDLTGVQREVWDAIFAGEALYRDTLGQPPVDRLVVDLHSSSLRGKIGRTVISMGRPSPVAWAIRDLLAEHGHRGAGDEPWRCLDLTAASEAAAVHASGSLMALAETFGGVGITVEFPESTLDCTPETLDAVTLVTGSRPVTPWSGCGTQLFRDLSLGERVRGVRELVDFLADQRHR